MNFKFFVLACLAFSFALFTVSCAKESETVIIDSSSPQGVFSENKKGSIATVNVTNSKGTVSLGTDAQGITFVKLGSDFMTELSTGTVTVFLSTSEMYKADPMKGNPDLKLVGIVNKNGEMYFKMSENPGTKFTHLILWCATAGIPFGVANLK